jgi:plasmid stability protein
MSSITLKEIPSKLHNQLKLLAKQHRRSLNSEVIDRLEKSIEPRQVDSALLLETARRFRSTLTFEATEQEVTKAKRQGRR